MIYTVLVFIKKKKSLLWIVEMKQQAGVHVTSMVKTQVYVWSSTMLLMNTNVIYGQLIKRC